MISGITRDLALEHNLAYKFDSVYEYVIHNLGHDKAVQHFKAILEEKKNSMLFRKTCLKVSPVSNDDDDDYDAAAAADHKSSFWLVLQNVSHYVVNKHRTHWCHHYYQVKPVLHTQNALFSSSKLVAILGPSGSGKSTLLKIILGQINTTNNTESQVCIAKKCSQKLKMAFVGQEDYLPERLTLEEAMLLASRLKNPNKNARFHQNNCAKICKLLCLDQICGNSLHKCSGGQRRRISIGLELLSNPNILILDEPTTGLDSNSCWQLVRFLRKMVQDQSRPVTVIATIHQPSSKVFAHFDQVHVISKVGRAIYNGKPEDMVNCLSQVNIQCPTYHNPADFIIEIAAGEYGTNQLRKLTNLNERMIDLVQQQNDLHFSTLQEALINKERTLVVESYALIIMMYKMYSRDRFMLTTRLLVPVVLATFNSLTFGHVGRASGCMPNMYQLYSEEDPQELFQSQQWKRMRVYHNLSSIYIAALNLFYLGMTPVLLFFSKEFGNIRKQHRNGWHSILGYLIAKILIECFLMSIGVLLYQSIWYRLTEQIEDDLIRYWSLFVIFNLFQIFGFVQGLMFGAFFSSSATKSVYMGTLSMLPFVLLSGFIVRTNRVSPWMRPLTYLSYFRFGFETILITLYGHNRCSAPSAAQIAKLEKLPTPGWIKLIGLIEPSIEQQDKVHITNHILDMLYGKREQHQQQQMSFILNEFNIDESQYWPNMIALVVLLIALLTITYSVIHRKITRS